MKILVIGSGGREHALAWALARSPEVEKVIVAPGSAGMGRVAECVPVDVADHGAVAELCRTERIDLVVIGPERPLIAGLADDLRAKGIAVFGPGADGARIEGSKVFAKNLFRDAGIPTARFETFDNADSAEVRAREWQGPLVVKADGEAFGKGVLLCDTPDDAVQAVRTVMRSEAFGSAGHMVVLEERLTGAEMSLFALCDGKSVLPFQTAQDYKRIGEGDTGPNTGGMGVVSPVPFVTDEMRKAAVDKILVPTVQALLERGIDYRGLLYAGLMWTADGWKILEYNCRFGDPETQALLPRLESDLAPLLMAAANGDLGGRELCWSDDASACVVLASEGYPGAYEKGRIIRGLRLAEGMGALVFHAGTSRNDQRLFSTSGGRVLNVTTTGATIAEALEKAYEAADAIEFEGKQMRRDIGRNQYAGKDLKA